jgi:hypothetical protein
MENMRKGANETFCVCIDGIQYSKHVYFTDAIKTAMGVANIFADAHIEVLSDEEAVQAVA